MPSGGSVGYKDGHAVWHKFNDPINPTLPRTLEVKFSGDEPTSRRPTRLTWIQTVELARRPRIVIGQICALELRFSRRLLRPLISNDLNDRHRIGLKFYRQVSCVGEPSRPV